MSGLFAKPPLYSKLCGTDREVYLVYLKQYENYLQFNRAAADLDVGNVIRHSSTAQSSQFVPQQMDSICANGISNIGGVSGLPVGNTFKARQPHYLHSKNGDEGVGGRKSNMNQQDFHFGKLRNDVLRVRLDTEKIRKSRELEQLRISREFRKSRQESDFDEESCLKRKEFNDTYVSRKIVENKYAELKAKQALNMWDDSSVEYGRRKEHMLRRNRYQDTSLFLKMKKLKEHSEKRILSDLVVDQNNWIKKVEEKITPLNVNQPLVLNSSIKSADGCPLVPEELLIEANIKLDQQFKLVEELRTEKGDFDYDQVRTPVFHDRPVSSVKPKLIPGVTPIAEGIAIIKRSVVARKKEALRLSKLGASQCEEMDCDDFGYY